LLRDLSCHIPPRLLDTVFAVQCVGSGPHVKFPEHQHYYIATDGDFEKGFGIRKFTLTFNLSWSLLLLLFLLCSQTVEAGTHCTGPSSTICTLTGDGDIYGLGIRLGSYLQFTSSVIAPYFAPTQINRSCLAFCAFTLASYSAVLTNGSHGDYIALYSHIMLLLALFLGYFTYYFNTVTTVMRE
jgi:hypothetical protein